VKRRAALQRSRAALLAALSLALLLAALGCAGGPTIRGWSGATAGPTKALYVGSMDGRLYALNPSARAQNQPFPAEGEWVYPALDQPALRGPARSSGLGCAPSPSNVGIYGTPATVKSDNETFVLFASDGGRVYAVSAASGQLRWQYPHESDLTIGPVIGSPVVVGDTLYVASADASVYALDTKTGDRKWRSTTNGRIWTTPAVAGDAVYVGTFEGSGYAFSAKDGKQVWKADVGAAVASVAASGTGVVLFGSFDNELRAYNSSNGALLWHFAGGNWFWSAPLIAGDAVYATCLDGSLYSLNLKTGERLWSADTKGPAASTPVLAGEQLVTVSQPGNLSVIRARDGVAVKTFTVGTEVLAPPFVSDSTVYVHGRDQRMYAVNIETGNTVWKQALTPGA